MDKQIAKIKDHMSKKTGGGRDDAAARAAADKYVAANPEKFDQMRTLTIHELVQSVEVFREANMEESQWLVETWLLHRYEPLKVGGTFEPTVRIPTDTNGAK